MRLLDFFSSLQEKIHTQKALEEFEEDMLHFPSFLFLTVLAALIVSFGILRENQPVIIGGMIITPLVNPFIGIPLGIVTKRPILFWKSVLYAFSGTFLFFLCSLLIGISFHIEESQIWLLKTTTLEYTDIAIAVLSGMVAALAISSPKVQNRLSGAAIALALAPPLAVSAINYAGGNAQFFETALFLFLINALGLIIIGWIIFLIFGFHKKETL